MKQLFLLLIYLSFISCSSRNATTSSDVRPVKSTIAQAATYIEKDFVGMATPLNEVNLAFKVAGQILDIPVSTGNSVSKGELLASLDPRDFELVVEADKSAYQQAKSRLERAKRLLEREAISRQEYENALSLYAQSKSTYENSKDLLSQTSITAPFAAVVERVYAYNFERVQSGQEILRIVEPRTNEVGFSVPESSLASLSLPSTRFSVKFDNYRDMVFVAQLVDYAVTTSAAAGYSVLLSFDNPDPQLYPIAPGFSCTITIESKDPVAGAISLPLSAIYAPAQGGTYVWVVTSDNRIERRSVTLGELYSSDRIIVDSGVKSGERVVTAGVYKLQDGDKVKLIN